MLQKESWPKQIAGWICFASLVAIIYLKVRYDL